MGKPKTQPARGDFMPQRLAEARKRRGWSQMELSFRVREYTRGEVKADPSQLSRYELWPKKPGVSRVPGADILGALCAVLECSADYLLNLTDKEKP